MKFPPMQRILIPMALVAVAFAGCRNSQQCCGPLVGNVMGTRIASPGTGTIAYPNTMASNTPYYNAATNAPAGTSPTVNTAQGWRNAGTAPGNTLSLMPGGAQTNPNLVAVNPAQPQPGNVTTASSSSLLKPGGNIQIAQATTGLPANQPGFVGGNGAMPLTDATGQGVPQMAGGNTGILGRTWEYVSRPMPQGSGNLAAMPQPYNGPMMNYGGVNYTNAAVPGINPGYSPYGMQQGTVADQWRPRDAR